MVLSELGVSACDNDSESVLSPSGFVKTRNLEKDFSACGEAGSGDGAIVGC